MGMDGKRKIKPGKGWEEKQEKLEEFGEGRGREIGGWGKL